MNIHEPSTLSHAHLKTVDADTFNAFVKANGILNDREMFHSFCDRLDVEMSYLEMWIEFVTWGRDAIIAAEDARDEAETLADSLV